MDNYNRLVEVLSTDEVESINKQWSTAPPLRIATVCSGTDAPILALEQLLSVLNNDKNEKIQMEHVFSCENSKFKRDFIEETTNPSLIFNDVVGLATGKGECHDGTVRKVPDDFNVLIAGTECVDFSSLSTSPKTLKGGGRSDITFWATHKLAKKYQPSIVVLENVAKCPMNEMAKAFEDIGYVATFRKVCTSEYLLPQSRSRIYFVFVHKDSAQYKEDCTKCDWVSKMEALGPNRQTNVKISWNDILLSEGTEPSSKKSKKKGGRGKSLAESLSSKWLAEIVAIEKKEGLTPYADEDGGRPYSEATKNIEVLAHLPDRAKMRLDVQFKRAVKAGVDPLKIPLIWNPAQQLRFTDSGVDSNGKPKTTIAPCVTPGHEWIVSSLKRPLSGEEALALQGITVSKKALKQFECRQLRDLAGNAMSTTVVAAVFLSIFTTIELSDNGKKRSVSKDDSTEQKQSSKKQKAN